jgi:hypothetical protein
MKHNRKKYIIDTATELYRHFEVKKSQIKNAGLGVYYTGRRIIPAGKRLFIYAGKLYGKPYSNCPDKSHRYCYGITGNVCVNATNIRSSNVARYINDARESPFKCNVDWEEFNKRHEVYIKTTESICPNDELFINYGRDYWTD